MIEKKQSIIRWRNENERDQHLRDYQILGYKVAAALDHYSGNGGFSEVSLTRDTEQPHYQELVEIEKEIEKTKLAIQALLANQNGIQFQQYRKQELGSYLFKILAYLGVVGALLMVFFIVYNGYNTLYLILLIVSVLIALLAFIMVPRYKIKDVAFTKSMDAVKQLDALYRKAQKLK